MSSAAPSQTYLLPEDMERLRNDHPELAARIDDANWCPASVSVSDYHADIWFRRPVTVRNRRKPGFYPSAN